MPLLLHTLTWSRPKKLRNASERADKGLEQDGAKDSLMRALDEPVKQQRQITSTSAKGCTPDGNENGSSVETKALS